MDTPDRVKGNRIGRRSILLAATTTIVAGSIAGDLEAQAQAPAVPLASWNDGPAKQAILDFVHADHRSGEQGFRRAGGPHRHVRPGRHAVGGASASTPRRCSRWSACTRWRRGHPEWRTHEPFKSVLSNDLAAIAPFRRARLGGDRLLDACRDEPGRLPEIATKWLIGSQGPRFKRLYTELVYQPMREVMDLLRANQFEVYIVTGGGQDFVRAYAQRVYGVPTQNVIGSSIATKYADQGRQARTDCASRSCSSTTMPTARRSASTCSSANALTPRSATPPATARCWNGPAPATGARLKMLVYHDDAAREYAYGPAGGLPDTKVGTFTQALMDEAKARRLGRSSA